MKTFDTLSNEEKAYAKEVAESSGFNLLIECVCSDISNKLLVTDPTEKEKLSELVAQYQGVIRMKAIGTNRFKEIY